MYEPYTRAGTAFIEYFADIQEQESTARVARGERTTEDQAWETFKSEKEKEHMKSFPLNENLYALLFYCLSDLDSRQRENFETITSTQSLEVKDYTFEDLRRIFIKHFCQNNSLENPNLRESGGHGGMKSFCVLEDVEYDGAFGYWAEEEETGDQGFLDETEDAFWVWNEDEQAFVGRFFSGRKMRRGRSKGKGKGRGRKGYSRMRPFKRRGYAHQTDCLLYTSPSPPDS